MAESDETKRHKRIYLLPNLFTTGGLFAGFYAIVAAMKGHFDIAATAIFIAMIADTLDGRVARLTNTASAFGAQYDSLSDMVAFGVAPSLVAYQWSLHQLGKIGWLVAFCFTVCCALRLARFNTQLETQNKRYFQGIPCPAAAGILAGFVWAGHEYGVLGESIDIVVAVITFTVAALMVSNVPYNSFKELDFKGHVHFFAIIIVALIYVVISIDPPSVLFLIFGFYGLSGPVNAMMGYCRQRSRKKPSKRKPVAKKTSDK